MNARRGTRPSATKPGRKPAAIAASNAPETFDGRLGWHEGRPIVTWSDGQGQQQAVPDLADISPALREARDEELAVSFELADGAPIHIRKAGDKWRVLASVLGGTPAVITETLQELCARGFAPDQIVIFTTTIGERGLDDRFERALHALCDEVGVAAPDYRPVELLRGADGAPLPDIRSDGDNVAAANVIANRVRELTRYPQTVIHASVAGGRKTMGTLLSDAMSLFGRGPDAVSHVLVQPEAAERATNFYYRPRVPFALIDRADQPIQDSQGRRLTSDDVQLDLASKPFFRLRSAIDEPLLSSTDAQIDFAEVTAAINVTVNRPKLIVHGAATGEIEIADFKRVKLDPVHYALFRVVAEATMGLLAGIRSDGTLTAGDFQSRATERDPPEAEAAVRAGLRPAALRYVDILRQLRHPGETWQAFRGSEFWRSDEDKVAGTGTAIWRIPEYEQAINYINPILNRINDALAERFGSNAVAQLYGIDRRGRGPMRFRLTCEPNLIDLRD